MIIVLTSDATEVQKQRVVDKIHSLGLKTMVSKGVERTIIGVIGEEDVVGIQPLEIYPGVEKVIPVLAPYKLVSREFKKESSIIKVKEDIEVGGEKIIIMAGPCSVENPDILFQTAREVKKAGALILRGGAFKPRTSPYSFQGLGEEGLRYLRQAADETGLAIITELMDPRDTELVERYTDIIQIGARNIQNFNLLKEVGQSKKPVLLKRGMMSTVKELLMSAEYILSTGNFNVILCERGIRTFAEQTRFTLDLSAVPVVRQLSHLPIVVDPSHGTGKWGLISPMSKAAIAAGCDGLLIEVHPRPEEALSDGPQSLLVEKFSEVMDELRRVAKAIGRSI